MKTWLRGAGLLLALVGLAGCGVTDEVRDDEGRDDEEGVELEAREPRANDTRASPGFEYFEDFEGRVGPEWSSARTHVTPVGGRRFLGEFGVEEVTLSLKDLPRHDTVTVSFDLFVLLTWDGNDNFFFSPDIWRLSVDGGPTLLETTFSNDDFPFVPQFFQSYPQGFPSGGNPGLTGAAEKGTLGYPDESGYVGVGDSVYRLSFTFRHTGGSLTLRFASPPRSDANELWGLDNVRVRLGSDEGRGETRWVLHPRGGGDDGAEAVAHDRDGNIVVAGFFNNRLEGGPLALEGGGPGTVLVAKLRPNGERIWARAFPGGSALVRAVTVDRDRNIVLTGLVFGEEPIDFGGGPLLGTFLVKLDREGRHLWSRRFNRFPPNALATDSGGHILLAGDITDFPVDFGSGPLSTGADSMGVLVRFNPDGGLEWVRGGSTDFRFSHRGVAVDSRDQVYTSGGDGQGRPFIEKVSPDGRQLWMRVLGTVGETFDVAVHGNRVVATGNFSDPFTFRGRDLLPSPSLLGVFLVAYTRDGEERWGRAIGGEFTSLAMDPRDGVIVTGQYPDRADLGLGPVSGSPFGSNFFAAKYDRIHGDVRWVRAFPSLNATVRDIAAAKDGESTLVGSFRAPVDFGFGTVTPTAGSDDLFILRLGK